MKAKNIFERNARKTLIAIVITTILITDMALANLFRLFMGYSFHERAKMHHYEIERRYRIHSEIYHHDLVGNFYTESASWGPKKYTLATDSLGFKSERPQDTPLVSDKYRILLIGDSFTEGLGVSYRETFSGRIASALSQKNIDVLNAAASSYSPIIYYRKVKYLLTTRGLKFNELVVFIDISDIEDEAIYYEMAPNNTVRDREYGNYNDRNKTNDIEKSKGVRGIIEKHSIFSYLLLNGIHDYLNKEKDTAPSFDTNLRRSMWTIDPQLYQNYGIDGLTQATYYMDLLYNLLQQHGVTLTIAVYPWPDQIINDDLESIQVTYWQKWAEEKQIWFLNYFPCFIKRDCDTQCRQETLENYFIEGDIHWNESGHAVIADGFLSFYTEKANSNIEYAQPMCF